MGARVDSVTTKVRTLGLVGHRGSGKTQLAEVLLHAGGVVREPGSVADGTSLLAFEPEERARGGASLWPAFAWLSWGDTTVQLVDTPGAEGASWLSRLALSGVDAELLVVSGVAGVERVAEDVLRTSRHVDRPLLVVVDKVDQPLDVATLLADVAAHARRPALPLQHVVRGAGGSPDVLVDVVTGRAWVWSDHTPTEVDVPAHAADDVARARHELVELVRAVAPELAPAGDDVAVDGLWQGLALAVRDGELVPVLFASGLTGFGAHALLDVAVALTPCPLDWRLPPESDATPSLVVQWIASRLDEDGQVVAFLRVWSGSASPNATWRNARTGQTTKVRKLYEVRGPRRALARHHGAGVILAVWEDLPGLPGDTFTEGPRVPLGPPASRPPMAWTSLVARDALHREKLLAHLGKLSRIDPSVRVDDEPLTGSIRLAGGHPAQLDLVVALLRGRLKVPVETAPPPVRYLERPVRAVTGVHALHRREKNGLVTEYGEVWIDLLPTCAGDAAALDPGEEGALRFRSTIDEDVLPTRFVAPLAEGARQALRRGPLAGYPVRGVSITATSGEYDVLESVEAHFVTAGALAMEEALVQAGTELLEPWTEVHVFVASACVGDVLSDLSAARGRVVGLEVDHGDETAILVWLPDKELLALAARLHARTDGRAWFIARGRHYEPLPANLVADAVAASPFRRVRDTHA